MIPTNETKLEYVVIRKEGEGNVFCETSIRGYSIGI